MKYLFLTLALASSSLASAYTVNVKGHFKSNGTYVQPHVRSSPDSTTLNNYGSTYNSGSSKNSYGNSNSNSYGSGSSWNSNNNDNDND